MKNACQTVLLSAAAEKHRAAKNKSPAVILCQPAQLRQSVCYFRYTKIYFGYILRLYYNAFSGKNQINLFATNFYVGIMLLYIYILEEKHFAGFIF